MRNYDFKNLKTDTLDIIDKFFATHSVDTPFTAEDIGLHGSQCACFVRAEIFEVVGSVEIWYKVDEDTMKRGEAKVYRLLEMPYQIREAVLLSKIENITRKVNLAKMNITFLSDHLRRYADEIDRLNAMR